MPKADCAVLPERKEVTMLFRDTGRELTVYITNDEEEFLRVEAELVSEGVRYRVWTTSEYPVFGWTRIDVAEQDRQNLVAANMAVRRVTGKLMNAEPVSEII